MPLSSEAPGQRSGKTRSLSGAPHNRARVGATDLIGAHSTPGTPWLDLSSFLRKIDKVKTASARRTPH